MNSQKTLIENLEICFPDIVDTLYNIFEDDKISLFMTRPLCDMICKLVIYNVKNNCYELDRPDINIVIIISQSDKVFQFIVDDYVYIYKIPEDFDVTFESYDFGINIELDKALFLAPH